jgi:GNAT superfamily N-acetyltransferase
LAYARLGKMGLNFTAVDQTSEITQEQTNNAFCFVAILDSKLVGTITVRPPDANAEGDYFKKPGVATAHQFAVSPKIQGKGIGRKLIQQAETWATGQNFTEIALDTAEPATHLVDFYIRLGYSKVDWVQWPGKTYPSVIMSKSLNENN